MFFRRWRARRREAIAQRWIVEQTRLPPVPIPALGIDRVALEGWQRAQMAARKVVDPLAALPFEANDIASKVQALWEWQTRFAPWLG